MKKNTLIIISSLLLISIYAIFGCSSEIKDDDIITGKWIETKVLLDSLATPCEKKSYIEFSEYKIDFQDRIFSQYNACTVIDTFEVEGGTETRTILPYTEIMGYYSIYGDTLFVKDVNNLTHIYTIDTINSEKMSLRTLDRDGNIVNLSYRRFKE